MTQETLLAGIRKSKGFWEERQKHAKLMAEAYQNEEDMIFGKELSQIIDVIEILSNQIKKPYT